MRQRVTIVDKQDNVLRYKNREECLPSDIERASALWLTNSKGEILIAQRAYTKPRDGGKWGPAVAGTVEEGETYDSNIIKEAEEEIGLKNITPRKGPKIFRGTHFSQWYFLTLDTPLSGFTLQTEEVAAIQWISKETLLKEIKKDPCRFLAKMREYAEMF